MQWSSFSFVPYHKGNIHAQLWRPGDIDFEQHATGLLFMAMVAGPSSALEPAEAVRTETDITASDHRRRPRAAAAGRPRLRRGPPYASLSIHLVQGELAVFCYRS